MFEAFIFNVIIYLKCESVSRSVMSNSATPWTVARQAPLSMEFSRQEVCSGDLNLLLCYLGFPHSSVGKESACNAGDPGLIPGSGRSLEKGKATHS